MLRDQSRSIKQNGRQKDDHHPEQKSYLRNQQSKARQRPFFAAAEVIPFP